MRTSAPAAFAFACFAAAVLAGCSDSGGTGTLRVQATDAPDDIGDFSSLTIHVDKITIRGEDGSHDYEPANDTFDLTKLQNGNVTTLFKGEVPEGNYTYLEISIESASGVLKAGGNTVDVKAPSNRIFLNTHFKVVEDEETTFLFDIQVHQVGNGDYQLKPNADGSRSSR